MFLFYLIATLIISILFPKYGFYLYNLKYTIPFCLIIIYFCLGLSSSLNSIKKSLQKIKISIIIQSLIFIIAPIIALILYTIINPFNFTPHLIGLLFISGVPTTMTSCILLSKKYGGDEILALCNAMIAQIIGVFLTPIIIYILLSSNHNITTSLANIFYKLLNQVLLPFCIGLYINRFTNNNIVKKISKKVIYSGIFPLIYLSVSQVVYNGDLISIIEKSYVLIIISIIFCILVILSSLIISKIFNFDKKTKITILLVGTNKTMGLGIPLTLIYFPNNPQLSTNIILMFLSYYIFTLVFTPIVSNLVYKKN